MPLDRAVRATFDILFFSPSIPSPLWTKPPEASFLKVSLRLCSELAPTQRWSPAQLAPTRKLAPTGVFKKLLWVWRNGQMWLFVFYI
jgi:hypothetical protein